MAITVTDAWTVAWAIQPSISSENAPSVAVILPLSRLMFSAQYAGFCKWRRSGGGADELALPNDGCPSAVEPSQFIFGRL
jgi:hypothetical protein